MTTTERIPTAKLLADKGDWWITLLGSLGKIVHSRPETVLFKAQGAEAWIHRNALKEPLVGLGAFRCIGFDRLPYTVIGVSAGGSRLNLQADKVKRLYRKQGDNAWTIEPDKAGEVITALRRKDGSWWSGDKGLFVIGRREFYAEGMA